MGNERKMTVRRISFSSEEETILQEKAQTVGMTVSGYIRRQALDGSIISIDWNKLQQHTQAINDLSEAFDAYTKNRKTNGLLYMTDLELIHRSLDEVKTLEVQLIAEITQCA